jgi:hypothetical protein
MRAARTVILKHIILLILCFVNCAPRYICVIKTKLMHYLSSVYFANQSLHVSGIFVVHHQEVYCTRICTVGTCCAFPPDDGLQICPKHVEVDQRNKLRINCALS